MISAISKLTMNLVKTQFIILCIPCNNNANKYDKNNKK